MMEKIKTKECDIKSLNIIPNQKVIPHLQEFVDKLDDEMKSYLTKNKPIQSIELADYLNPQWSNIINLIYGVHLNHIPEVYVKSKGIQTKSQLLDDLLTKLFHKFIIEKQNSEVPFINKDIDFSNPAEWFPEARKMKRKIIMHVGPTNSGKTYNSLKKLQIARSGYYAGPLRLLAREIFENFNDKGIYCNLLTGEEVIPTFDKDGKISSITSGTIEMIPLNKKMDLCIIDEIQMISDESRGESWTNALLGVQAKEIHLCGEERTVELIKKIVELTGDELEINHYKRLGPLSVEEKAIKNHQGLKKGDCVVAFAKGKILQLKMDIERETNLKVAVIYGALPPEIRSEQAKGFNDGKYDVLVASDAIGMGLNLAIKRIVFSTTRKFNGIKMEDLRQSTLKQIGGRAGRFSHDKTNVGGTITAYSTKDLNYVKKQMDGDVKDIQKGYIWPTNELWISYLRKFNKTDSILSILNIFNKKPINSTIFKLTQVEQRIEIMKLLMVDRLYKQLPIEDQIKLSIAPIARFDSEIFRDTSLKFINNIVNKTSKNVLDFGFLPLKILSEDSSRKSHSDTIIEKITNLEDCHKLVMLFMWLSQRFPYLFVDIESAYDWKSLIEKRISEELYHLRSSGTKRRKRF